MVTTGFSKPYVAKYSNTGSTVTYTTPSVLGRGVNLSLEINTADDNDFYADNTIEETETAQFTGGSATITVDGLTGDAASLVLGLLTEKTVTVGSEQVEFLSYGSGINPPYVGFGCVRRTMMKGVTEYWPFILPKVRFSIPSDEMETQESNINWQTQELTATIMRDDTEGTNWKYISKEGMSTEAAAEAAIKAFFGATS